MTPFVEPAPPSPADGDDALLSVEGLTVTMADRDGGRRPLVVGVDFEVGYGETVGIVGESGSGKSLTARAVAGLLPRGLEATGRVTYRGQSLLHARERDVARLRGSELSLLLQDPFTMLNPVVRCGTQLTELRRTPDGKRMRRAEARADAIARLAEVGISDPAVAERYPFQLSGGMRQRVALAASLAQEPQLLIADEPSTALDASTQRQILLLLKSLQLKRRMGLLLITHNLRVAFSVCDRVYVLYGGQVLEVGPARDIEAEPQHPYTLGLLQSEPPTDRRVARLNELPGRVPRAELAHTRCQFAPRCAWAVDACRAGRPALRMIEGKRGSACLRIDEIRPAVQAAWVAPIQEADHTAPDGVAPTTPVLTVRALDKCFRTDRHEHHALRGVSLEVLAGESVGLVGESGSGKTTFARCLLGLERPDRGELLLAGHDASNYRALSATERQRLHRTLQMVFQDPYSSLNPVRTIEATLSEAIVAGGERPSAERIAELLNEVGLPEAYTARKPRALSGGERQRVAIARALALRPQFLLCDEPVSALDMSVQAQMLTLFRRLQADLGIGYLFISHDLAAVRQVTDRLYVLYKGEIVEHGPTGRVLDDPQHPYTRTLLDSVPRADPRWLVDQAKVQAGERPSGRSAAS